MKLFLATAALLLTAIAHATPKLGDYSEFQFTMSQAGQSMVGSYILAIVSDANDGTVGLSTTIHFDGQADQYQETKTEKTALLNDQTINDVLTNCAAYGGVIEQVAVPAGILNSCKMPTQDETGKIVGSMWTSTVPFGIAKQVQTSPEGVTYTLELKKYIVGQ
ncbi:MAG: hypothetical protein H7328_05980 [Bdellovibrio sp.]|nr:hypothetical protein [Bdellovibrio sp.]